MKKVLFLLLVLVFLGSCTKTDRRYEHNIISVVDDITLSTESLSCFDEVKLEEVNLPIDNIIMFSILGDPYVKERFIKTRTIQGTNVKIDYMQSFLLPDISIYKDYESNWRDYFKANNISLIDTDLHSCVWKVHVATEFTQYYEHSKIIKKHYERFFYVEDIAFAGVDVCYDGVFCAYGRSSVVWLFSDVEDWLISIMKMEV